MVHQKPTKLQIHPAPFKSSHLAIPPSPFSPRTPLGLASHPSQHRIHAYPAPDTNYVPPSPLQWLWQCHQCRCTYSLGVTRRCLEDGHEFCAGTTTVKTWRRPVRPARTKKHKACQSEFDYQGWKTWGRWRRSGRRDSSYDDSSSSSDSSMEDRDMVSRASSAPVKDCWNRCDYPSECRWGRRFGVHTPTAVEFPNHEALQTAAPASPSTTFEGILRPENCKEVRKEKKGEKTDFWGALMASATRRKSVSPSSPLAGIAEEVGSSSELMKDRDGDVVMTTGGIPALAVQDASSSSSGSLSPMAAAITSSAPVVTLKGMIRKSLKRVGKTSRLADIRERSEIEGSEAERSVEEMDFEAELSQLERVKSRDSGYHSVC